MKRFIATLVLFALSICLLSCSQTRTYEDGYEDGYSDGLFEGQVNGYSEGISEAQHDIAFRVEDELWSLAWDIEDKYGIHPEEAVQILSNYVDVPDEVDEAKLHTAILAIYHYYYDSHEVMNGIEDYWID